MGEILICAKLLGIHHAFAHQFLSYTTTQRVGLAPFFQTCRVMAAILRASVRRAGRAARWFAVLRRPKRPALTLQPLLSTQAPLENWR